MGRGWGRNCTGFFGGFSGHCSGGSHLLVLLCNGGEVLVNLGLVEDVELGLVLAHHRHLQQQYHSMRKYI